MQPLDVGAGHPNRNKGVLCTVPPEDRDSSKVGRIPSGEKTGQGHDPPRSETLGLCRGEGQRRALAETDQNHLIPIKPPLDFQSVQEGFQGRHP